MYQDTNRIRKYRVPVNLDEYEAALIQALVNYTGLEKSVLVRQMLMAQAEATLLPTAPIMPGAALGCAAHLSHF